MTSNNVYEPRYTYSLLLWFTLLYHLVELLLQLNCGNFPRLNHHQLCGDLRKHFPPGSLVVRNPPDHVWRRMVRIPQPQ